MPDGGGQPVPAGLARRPARRAHGRYPSVAMAEGTLRVAQLNAGSLLEPGWDERREVLVTWLEHLAPDVVCLQEVWRDGTGADTAAWIVDHLGVTDWYWRFGGDAFAPGLWPDATLAFGSAILSRWPIDAHAYHRLPVSGGRDPVVDSVPWELLHVRTAGLDVFSTHLAPAPTHGLHRQRQVVADRRSRPRASAARSTTSGRLRHPARGHAGDPVRRLQRRARQRRDPVPVRAHADRRAARRSGSTPGARRAPGRG